MADTRTYKDRKEYRAAWAARNRARIREYERKRHERLPDYRRDRAMARYAERRVLIDAIKLDRGCIDCGYREAACALDFDHRDPEHKLFTISQSMQRNLDLLLAEIAKCDVRCRNCHAIRTKEQRLGGRPRTVGG